MSEGAFADMVAVVIFRKMKDKLNKVLSNVSKVVYKSYKLFRIQCKETAQIMTLSQCGYNEKF